MTAPQMLRLWGLPYKVKRAQITEFLAGASKKLKKAVEGDDDDLLIGKLKKGSAADDKKPRPGECWVRNLAPKLMEKAVEKLHKKEIEGRWVEVTVVEDVLAVPAEDSTADAGEGDEDAGEPDAKRRRTDTTESGGGDAKSGSGLRKDVEPLLSGSSGRLAIGLRGLPFSDPNGADSSAPFDEAALKKFVNGLKGEGEGELPKVKTADLVCGRKARWQLAQAASSGYAASGSGGLGEPAKGEAWVHLHQAENALRFTVDEVVQLLQALHHATCGARYLEASVLDLGTGEPALLLPSAGKGAAKGDGKGAKGKGKGKGAGSDPKEREVYVRFIPYESTEEEIRTLFETVGPVARVKLYSKAGLGFVTYADADGAGIATAKRAVEELDATPMGNRTLAVCLGMDKDKGGNSSSSASGEDSSIDNQSKLFVTGLPFEATEDGVREAIVGALEKLSSSDSAKDAAAFAVELIVEKERNRFLGRAIVDFSGADCKTNHAPALVKRFLADGKAFRYGGSSGRPMRLAFARDKFDAEAAAGSGSKGKGKGKAGGKGGVEDAPHQLFLKYLPWEATEKCIKDRIEEAKTEPVEGEDDGIPPEAKEETSSDANITPQRLKLCKDRATGESRGIGFINYAKKEDAEAALARLNGLSFWDKHIEVSWAVPR